MRLRFAIPKPLYALGFRPLLLLVICSVFLFLLGGVSFGQTPTPAPAPTVAAPSVAPENSPDVTWQDDFDHYFRRIMVDPLMTLLFFDFGTQKSLGVKVPFVVLWLLFGALFFTVRMSFINFRGFWHAIQVTRGKFDKPGEKGEVSHFQALASALSATVGLGNIAGVAIAVGKGGPGAIFWLILAGIFGMSSKFVECTLGQMYRKVEHDGTVTGGGMYYLKEGFAELGLPRIGVFLSVLFSLLCMGASVGGGCVFQVSQSLNALKTQIDFLEGSNSWVYGAILAFCTGVVIIGGIRRIAATAEKIVPLMCGVYVAAAIFILFQHYDHILPAFQLIVTSAFSSDAIYGGFIGVMVIGIQRAAFSNEAGIGSAPIAHAAAKTDEPVSEGIVALLEPFIDTVIVCTMTGLVIVITGVYADPACADYIAKDNGSALTAAAFGSVLGWFPYVLMFTTVLFAYSTMISWSYYGERCCRRLFGPRSSIVYKLVFIAFIMIGSVATASSLLDFSDALLLSMAFPNILGGIFLSGKVKRRLDDYWRKYKLGELDPNYAAKE